MRTQLWHEGVLGIMAEPDPKPWWQGLPFQRHWRTYVALKLLVLALALLIALGLFGVI